RFLRFVLREGTAGYIAVTAEEVAIVRAKPGLLKPKVGSEVVARVARTTSLRPSSTRAPGRRPSRSSSRTAAFGTSRCRRCTGRRPSRSSGYSAAASADSAPALPARPVPRLRRLEPEPREHELHERQEVRPLLWRAKAAAEQRFLTAPEPRICLKRVPSPVTPPVRVRVETHESRAREPLPFPSASGRLNTPTGGEPFSAAASLSERQATGKATWR